MSKCGYIEKQQWHLVTSAHSKSCKAKKLCLKERHHNAIMETHQHKTTQTVLQKAWKNKYMASWMLQRQLTNFPHNCYKEPKNKVQN